MSYGFYRAITIDHTQVGGSDSSDFTVLISGTYTWMATVANGGRIQNTTTVSIGGRSITVPTDLVFSSDSAGASPFSWEFESYDPTTGTVNVWIKLSTLSHSADTVLYAVYGDTTVTTFQGGSRGAAWDSNALAIYHLPDGTTLYAYNSTATTTIDGTITAATAATGQIDGGVSLDGSTTYIDMGASKTALQPSSAVTVSCWVTPTSGTQASGAGMVVQDYSEPRAAPYCSYKIGCDGSYAGQIAVSGVGIGVGSGVAISNGVPAFVALTYDGSTLAIYVNGVLEGSTSASGSLQYSNGNFRIGANSDGTEIPTAIVDEVKICSVARSADWILAEFNNQSAPASFYAMGLEEILNYPSDAWKAVFSSYLDADHFVQWEKYANDNSYAKFYVGPYAKYRSVTIDALGGSDLTDFTVLISGTYSWMATVANSGEIQQTTSVVVKSKDGTTQRTITVPADLIFALDTNGSQTLSWEFESYDPSTGAVNIWVKLPTVSASSSTVFYVHYGSSQVTTFQGGPLGAAWDSGFLGVYHLPDGSILYAYDSTANASNTTVSGATAGTGQIDGAASFSATAITINPYTFPSDFSVSCWYKGMGDGQFFFQTNNSTPLVYLGVGDMGGGGGSGKLVLTARNDSSSLTTVSSSGGINDGNWHLVHGLRSGGTLTVFVDGGSAGSGSLSGTITSNTGASISVPFMDHGLVGLVDELRISSVARSADWIAAEYSNQTDAYDFCTFGTETSWSSVSNNFSDFPSAISAAVTARNDGAKVAIFFLRGWTLTSDQVGGDSIGLAGVDLEHPTIIAATDAAINTRPILPRGIRCV